MGLEAGGGLRRRVGGTPLVSEFCRRAWDRVVGGGGGGERMSVWDGCVAEDTKLEGGQHLRLKRVRGRRRRSTGWPSGHAPEHGAAVEARGAACQRSAHHDLLIGSSIVFVGHVRMTTRPLHVVVAVIDAGGGHFRGVYRGGEGEQLLRGRLPGVHPSAITVRRAIHTEVRSLTDSWGATGKDE
eukprot:CAMPEP_0172549286 /NCGR_PEP_ID=MMETSP1067-20121228/18413_1 /TAXON_ID=265564 ORGANISM="Thalassiosira punctigera, Strain Tpunct2005C2" /NCGR_SAMPLE_ID=MMETSP1067 /ASSEMBLY_ACC=CAM_ASM_000444 /LENGTH=183 /DNA_ID=CAMNT_0013336649 /DNA_START=98 /DNA_END=650 /DNA_ORIENTATION=+